MKTRDFLWGLLACAALSACSSDEVVENPLKKNDSYIKVRIALSGGDMSSRTGTDYENGTPVEQKISNLYFAFYDAYGNWVADGIEHLNITPTPQTNGNNVEAITEAVIALEMPEDASKPKYMVAFVNIENASSIFGGKGGAPKLSLVQAQETIGSLETYAINDKFAMTNSTYYDGASVVFATPVEDKDFYESIDLAEDEGNPVEVYVERLAAKVRVSQKTEGTTIDPLTDGEGNTLEFEIKGFALNGTNTKSYYIKNTPEGWDWTTHSWSNDDSDFRSFWAKDVNYTDEPAGEYVLDYVSLNDVVLTLSPSSLTGYCRENTFPFSIFSSGNKYVVATHALILGQYEGVSVAELDGTFYMYSGTAYNAEDLKERIAPSTLVYTRFGEEYVSLDPSKYDIVAVPENPSEVCLKLNVPTDDTYYWNNGTEKVVIDNSNISDVNAELATFKAEGFYKGWAYFPVVIEHLNTNKEDDGAYGVVRNHVYDLKINSIRSLGTGIFSPDVDIIPDETLKKYYVSASLNILAWKKVSQDVEL